MKIYAITPINKKSSGLKKIAKTGVAIAAGVAMGLAAGAIHTKNNKTNEINNGNYGKVIIIMQQDSVKKSDTDYTQQGKFQYNYEDTKKSTPVMEKVEPEALPEIKDTKTEPVMEKIEPEILPEIKDTKTEPVMEKVEPKILPEIKDTKTEPVMEKIEPETMSNKNKVTGKGSLKLIAEYCKLKHNIEQWELSKSIYLSLGYTDKVNELQSQIKQARLRCADLQIQINENAKSREEAAKNN